MIDDIHRNRIHFSLTAINCFNNADVGKQPVAWKEYCAEYWLKVLQESMDRYTGNITEILLEIALNTIQSINHKVNKTEDSFVKGNHSDTEESIKEGSSENRLAVSWT